MRLHVVGNACMDTTFRVERLPAPGETLNAARYTQSVGGKGANQAIAAARTGAPVTLWTALGDDPEGERIAAALRCELTLDAVRLRRPSDCSAVMVAADGQNAIVSGVGCIQSYDPLTQSRLADTFGPGDMLLLQGNMTAAATIDCLHLASRSGAQAILNASPVSPVGERPDVDLAGLVVVNAVEAEALTGTASMQRAAVALAGSTDTVVTLGAAGCLVLRRGERAPLHIPAPFVAAVDTSGAGDVFCGCLAGFMAGGASLEDAAGLAVQAAAVAVTREGTMASCPSAAELRVLRGNKEIA